MGKRRYNRYSIQSERTKTLLGLGSVSGEPLEPAEKKVSGPRVSTEEVKAYSGNGTVGTLGSLPGMQSLLQKVNTGELELPQTIYEHQDYKDIRDSLRTRGGSTAST